MRATALLLLQLAAASAQSCANTCFQGSCDYWDGGVWGTCAVLESTYSCDCSGCECDGCPQGTCGVDQPFDPATCLNAGDARCDPGANTEACAWDGGDCCATTCVGTLCGSRHGYDCRDPAHAATDEEAQAEQDRAYDTGCGGSGGGSLLMLILAVGVLGPPAVWVVAKWARAARTAPEDGAGGAKGPAVEARAELVDLAESAAVVETLEDEEAAPAADAAALPVARASMPVEATSSKFAP